MKDIEETKKQLEEFDLRFDIAVDILKANLKREILAGANFTYGSISIGFIPTNMGTLMFKEYL